MGHYLYKVISCAILLLFITQNKVMAQAQSDGATAAAAAVAGYLSQSLEKQIINNDGVSPALKKPKEGIAAPKASSGETFYLKEITFSGFNKVPFSELSKEVEGYTNQTVSIDAIDTMSQQITQYIYSKGYLVQVVAPSQEIKDGVLKLLIQQATLGGINFTESGDSKPLQTSPERVRRAQQRAASYIYNEVPSGSTIDTRALDKALTILNNSVSNKTYTGTYQAGLGDGQTDLNLQAYRENTVVGGVDLNNFGVQTTGRAQVIGQLSIRDALNLDESFSLGAIASEGLSFFRAGYAMPLAPNGLKIVLDANALNYNSISNATTKAQGNSESQNIQLHYPISASKNGASTISVGVSNKKYENMTSGVMVSSYSLGAANMGLSGYFFSNIFFRAVDSYNLNLSNGSMYENNSPIQYQKNIVSGRYVSYVPNNYTKLTGAYAKTLDITENSNFRLAASGQIASANLNSAENFYVSGPDAVRAYMPSVAYGTQGFMMNADYNYSFNSGIGAGVFFDYAAVTQYKSTPTNTMINSSTAPNSYNISGAGAKVNYRYKETAFISAYVAKPLDNVNFPSLLNSGGKPAYVVGAQVKINL